MKCNYLPLLEASRALGVCPSTVSTWVIEGTLRARAAPRGTFEIAALSLVHLMLRNGMALPLGLQAPVRLVVIDDEPAMLRSTARMLKRRAPHLEVTLAEGAECGLREVLEKEPDAVLVDMHMPVLNGVEVCREIMKHDPRSEISLIAFSGRRDAELERDFENVGVRALLGKPPDVEQLLSILEVGLLQLDNCQRTLFQSEIVQSEIVSSGVRINGATA